MGPRFARRIAWLSLLAVGCSTAREAPRDGAAPADGSAQAGAAAGTGGAAGAGDAGGPDASVDLLGAVDLGSAVDLGNAGAAGASPDASPPMACAPLIAPPANDDPTGMPADDPALAGQQHKFFKLTVKAGDSGAPLPGATLTTTTKIALTTDTNGVVAFYEPGMMGLDVWFEVKHPGYEAPADAFGGHGKAFKVTEGGSGELTLARTTGAAGTAAGDLQSRLAQGNVPGRKQCMAIRVVDKANGRGVPVVDLAALGEHAWSDSQGIIAYCNPDHVGQSVTFDFASHGYKLAAGGAKVTLATTAGGAATVEVDRTMIGERLYRITGAGIYRDSVVLGLKTPLAKPTLLSQVAGSDTGSTAIYKGKVFWLWQDTDRLSYWLGNFRGTSATSALPGTAGGLSPNLGVDLTYIQGSDGFAAPMCPSCEGGPAWMAGIISVPDAAGAETMFAGYAVVNGDGSAKETGLARFDDAAGNFDRVITDFAKRTDFTRPDGHALKVGHGADAYVHYPDRLRIPATAAAFLDPSKYEQFSPYGANGSAALVKATDGTLDWKWRAGAKPTTSAALKTAGVAADQDLDGHILAVETGQSVTLTSNSYSWNAHRGRFVRVAQQLYGSSLLGEIWHAEADTPMGPWVYAQKVVTHDNYTFYNTFHHPEFERGRHMYFEGTYTNTYTNASPTPRFNYNQQMIRVDLDDARVVLPVSVYDLGKTLPGDFVTKAGLRRNAPAAAAAFLAPDRAMPKTVPVAWSTAACGPDRRLVAGGTPATTPLFWALPPETTPAPMGTVGLYEFAAADGRRAYAIADAPPPAGFTRAAKPLALVWKNPIRVALPVGSYLADLVVDGGDDQCVIGAGAAGADVTLDAARTSVAAGTLTKVRWSVPGAGGCMAADGTTAKIHLSPGLHEITVEAVDSNGNHGTDTVTILVK
jgi:hypothetical protein